MIRASAAALLAAACLIPSSAAALDGAQTLEPYFAALQTRSLVKGTHPVHVLQIGDSHSAGDSITGAWRSALQARYGSGGRGVLPPGSPYVGFLPHGISVRQTGAWKIEATFGKGLRPADDRAIFGLSGFRATSQSEGAGFSLTADGAEAFDRAIVCTVDGPGGGDYVLTLGAVSASVSTASPTPHLVCRTMQADGPQTGASVTTHGAVTFTSWATFNDDGGVAVSNLGVVGAQLRHFADVGDEAMATELRAYDPDLIVLAFGTNEGFSEHFDALAYRSLLRTQIERFKRLSGRAPLLVLGAPDADTRRCDLTHNEDPSGPPSTLAPTCSGARAADRWFPPPALGQVRQIQREVAAAEGVAFWDWGGRMGGPGAAEQWASGEPPLIRGDRVHYTTAGGAQLAGLLQADLDEAAAHGQR